MKPKHWLKNAISRQSAHAALMLILLALCALADTPSAECKGLISKLFSIGRGGPAPLPDPLAPDPGENKLVLPPGEEQYFPTRADNQPYGLREDTTVNLTGTLSAFYFNPQWRGEVWSPFDNFTIAERATRQLATWREYNEMSYFRVLNGVNYTLERWTGYGP